MGSHSSPWSSPVRTQLSSILALRSFYSRLFFLTCPRISLPLLFGPKSPLDMFVLSKQLMGILPSPASSSIPVSEHCHCPSLHTSHQTGNFLLTPSLLSPKPDPLPSSAIILPKHLLNACTSFPSSLLGPQGKLLFLIWSTSVAA